MATVTQSRMTAEQEHTQQLTKRERLPEVAVIGMGRLHS